MRFPLIVCAAVATSGLLALPARSAEGLARSNGPGGVLPRVFILDPAVVAAHRQRLREGDASLKPALEQLRLDAQEALTAGPFSVTTKKFTPPSGDKHDYMSQAPYFWPNPDTTNGLPFIRKDGQRNPQINSISDHRSLDQFSSTAETLALEYYFDANEACAERAVKLLRAWFLDPATRMNPNLKYAQAVLGVNDGRGIGLIETRSLTRVVDALGLLAGSPALTSEDERGIRTWFEDFTRWMKESRNGKEEAAAKNNHGTFYDVQSMSFALFLGRTNEAAEIARTAEQKRIARQVEPDGRQPLELVRTRAWSYSVANLSGLMLLAQLGERVGVDLWHYQTSDGRSIRKALDYLIPFALGEKKWPDQQLGTWPPQALYPLMREAAVKIPSPTDSLWAGKIPKANETQRSNLLDAW